MANTHPHVVVIGAGFGGLNAIRGLKSAPVRITVVDRSNHHLFQPLLYQVATAELNTGNIASPIRRILRHQKNADVILADVESIDVENREVILADGKIGFDYLVLAAGASHSYFGHDEWGQFAPGLKTLDDALEIRKRVLTAFEIAEREADPELVKAWLTFAVVGGGPTGTELAGTLSNVARYTLDRDYKHIQTDLARVVLIESGPKVLAAYPDPLPEKARKQLESLGVEVRLNAKVTDIDADGVSIGEEKIAAKTVLWGAGVAASDLGKSLGAPLDRNGRVKIQKTLTLPHNDRVYVVGDMVALEQDGKPVPGVAPAAMQMGTHAAKNILRALEGQPLQPFEYWDKGTVATIGRGKAVAKVGRFKLSGYIAWLLWAMIHIFFLVGFANRIMTMIAWVWAYVSYDRGARLITHNLDGPLAPGVSGDPESQPRRAEVAAPVAS